MVWHGLFRVIPFAFSVEKSTPAGKKYTSSAGDAGDKLQLCHWEDHDDHVDEDEDEIADIDDDFDVNLIITMAMFPNSLTSGSDIDINMLITEWL